MDILGAGQYLPTFNIQNGKNLPSQAVSQTTIAENDTRPPVKKVDMCNISLNEVNELIRSGVEGLLDVMPWSGVDLDKYINDSDGSYREYLANQKIDFIGQIENSIAFEKSRGQSTNFLENILENLNQINGTEFPAKIDIIA